MLGIEAATPAEREQTPLPIPPPQNAHCTCEKQGVTFPPEEGSETSGYIAPSAWAVIRPECGPLWPLPHYQQRELQPQFGAQPAHWLQYRL